MKLRRMALVLLLVFFLSGCRSGGDPLTPGLALRARLSSADGCAFDVSVAAHYGDTVRTFALHCQADSAGKVTFTVLQPEVISGITGTLSADGGALTFDDTALAFELLAQDRLSPVSSPWVLVNSLTRGYLTACAEWEEGAVLYLDDSYADDALQLTVWLGAEGVPAAAEISAEGSRILAMTVTNFTIL